MNRFLEEMIFSLELSEDSEATCVARFWNKGPYRGSGSPRA